MKLFSRLDSRKGITPVIAIVLLLMVTVGAVGVVYTQFQSLVGDPTEQIDAQQRNQNTDFRIVRAQSTDTGTPSNGNIILELQNTGSVARNTTSLRMTTDDPTNTAGSNGPKCTDPGNSSIVDPDQTINCYTGASFPSPTNGIGITLNLEGTSKSYSHICRPETTGTSFC